MIESGRAVGKRILLADDQEEVRETVKLLLGVDKHTVVEARNGREALGLFSHGQFDLVITDYAMPQMRGDELALAIKRLSPAQPILMVTGSAERHVLPDGCIDGFLSKPFMMDDLRQAVAHVLAVVPA
jgi:CheY-like chemotaxis protein